MSDRTRSIRGRELLPVNKIACRVTSPASVGMLDPKDLKTYKGAQVGAPEMRDIDEQVRRNPNFIDYTGRRSGSCVVVGLAVKRIRGRAAWVLRCACGLFTIMRTKSVREGKHHGCARCNAKFSQSVRRREYQDLSINQAKALDRRIELGSWYKYTKKYGRAAAIEEYSPNRYRLSTAKIEEVRQQLRTDASLELVFERDAE